jgi:hypothetical protein
VPRNFTSFFRKLLPGNYSYLDLTQKEATALKYGHRDLAVSRPTLRNQGLPGAAAARSQERAAAHLQAPPYLAFALAAAAAVAEGSAKATTRSPRVKLSPGLPPKP